MSGARRLVILFALTILVPGGILVAFGVRALLQERQLAEQQWREHLDRAAASAGEALSHEIDGWTSAIGPALRERNPGAVLLPEPLRRALATPGVAALTEDDRPDGTVWPEDAVAYRPSRVAPRRALKPDLVAAEGIELGGVDYAKAIAQYRALLQTAKGDDRAWLLHRLARASRKAGRLADAARALGELEQADGLSVGGIPADLLARYEERALAVEATGRSPDAAASADLYRDLVTGRWVLEEPRFRFYAARLREWAAMSPGTSAELAGADEVRSRREALTDALSNLELAERGGAYVVLRNSVGDARARKAALIIERAWLDQHLQSSVLASSTVAEGFLALAVPTSTGAVASIERTPPGGAGDLRASRLASAGGLVWRIDVWPEDSSAAFAQLARRQRLYLSMLVIVVAILGAGTYLTTRVLRREMELTRMKSDFLAAVSHEFRSPLTGIRQLGEMLARGRVPNETRRQEYYERIMRESDRLSRTVENLLDFSRMEEGRRPYRFERVDIASWLHRTVEAFQSQDAHRTHRVIADIDDSVPPARIDPEALATAVDNLLDNAVKYSPGSDTVRLDARPEDNGVLIRVRDQGVGIKPSDQPHVFDRFYRGAGTAAAGVPGTGLGLSLVREIVRAHGGRVALESEPGIGTTVSIHLKADI